ncbi:hypothetical protein L596_005157 [Steinernema carpocapsae]|uniref:Uncharacterized protein n=1 Tax=Steinernema carpocapsae TaxID=34508 RepID=A0A4U8V2B8_STECR|nr:hypothetical protein L596_005157 [Steinernema carpocapsae]
MSLPLSSRVHRFSFIPIFSRILPMFIDHSSKCTTLSSLFSGASGAVSSSNNFKLLRLPSKTKKDERLRERT